MVREKEMRHDAQLATYEARANKDGGNSHRQGSWIWCWTDCFFPLKLYFHASCLCYSELVTASQFKQAQKLIFSRTKRVQIVNVALCRSGRKLLFLLRVSIVTLTVARFNLSVPICIWIYKKAKNNKEFVLNRVLQQLTHLQDFLS